jgi:hypothetical protein
MFTVLTVRQSGVYVCGVVFFVVVLGFFLHKICKYYQFDCLHLTQYFVFVLSVKCC